MNRKSHGFQKMPFSFTENSDLDSVYQNHNYTMMLPLLMGSLENKVILTIVLGEDGVGKTTLINYMSKFFPTANIITADFQSTQQFFQQVLISFDQKVSHKNDYDMLLQLSFFLSAKFKKQSSQSTLLVFDNADKMSLDALKGLELLLGLNTERSQILQIILVGRPKLTNLLNNPSLYNLLQNSSTPFLLEPLSKEETQVYTNQKIKLAGRHKNKSFSEQTYSAIFNYSGGIPSTINLICDLFLLRSSELQKDEINSGLVLEIIKDQVGDEKKKNNSATSTLITLFSGIMLAFLVNKFILTSEILPENSHKELKNVVSKQETKIDQKIKKQEKVVKKEASFNRIQNKTSIIESQLAIAELQITNFKFSFPKKDNAYETYLAILKTSPGEKRAVKGLQRISNYYLERAKQKYLQGKDDKTQLLISKGLKVSPNHKELIEFKSRLADKNVKPRQKQDKIEALLKKAKQQFDALQYTKPVNDNAYSTYQEIITLDKNNSLAKNGVLKILSRLKSQAQQALLEQNYEVALENNEQVLMITSKGVKGSSHKKAVADTIEAKKVIVNRLMNLAEKQKKHKQFTQSVGDNAFESYNKVLEINPNHKGAIKGLDNLKIHYQKFAMGALSAKNIDRALKIISEGLKAFPNNSMLLALQNDAMLEQKTVKKSKISIIHKEAEAENKGQELKSFGTF